MWKAMLTFFAALGFGSAVASDFLANVEANTKTIKALIDAGSNPQKAHPLEHHFYCDSESCLNSLIAKGQSKGYQVAHTGNNVHEGRRYWYGDLIKETVLNLKLINRENVVMLELADEFGANYDGWGTPVIE